MRAVTKDRHSVLKAIDFFIALVPCSYCFISDRPIEFQFSSIASYLLLNVAKLQKVQRNFAKLKIKRLNVEIGRLILAVFPIASLSTSGYIFLKRKTVSGESDWDSWTK